MTDEEVHDYLLSKPAAWLDYPFGPDVRIYKVHKKMFATLGWEDNVGRSNLKCDPDMALALRELFDGVIPGYHMNKRHWNTVILDGSVPSSEIAMMIDHSYALVARSLPKAQRTALLIAHGEDEVYRGLVPGVNRPG
ncbi:MAG: MmcQ/YjbR family DNA-binding protein [Pseudomonadaceae bacterium]|nr:MmcQ/YjbR family DNA-binding protein [Pseudomonadaceae bacterium]